MFASGTGTKEGGGPRQVQGKKYGVRNYKEIVVAREDKSVNSNRGSLKGNKTYEWERSGGATGEGRTCLEGRWDKRRGLQNGSRSILQQVRKKEWSTNCENKLERSYHAS